MKKYLLPLIVAALLVGNAFAQSAAPHHGKHHEMPKVEDMVSNLSKQQQRKLASISAESKSQVEKKRAELDKVRQSIRLLMEQEGDQSAKLFPLLDRESDIEADIAKIMYRTRLQIDNVLTKAQIAEFRAKRDAERKKHESECKTAPCKQDPAAPARKTVHRKASPLTSKK